MAVNSKRWNLQNFGGFYYSSNIPPDTEAYLTPEQADYWVGPNGSGSANGLSAETPWSPAKGLTMATNESFVGRDTNICWLPGAGDELYLRAKPGGYNEAAFAPAHSGRSANERIVHYAAHAGSQLSNALTNPLRTELATTDTDVNNGCPHVGFREVNNVKFLGPVLNDAHGRFEIDGGALLIRGDDTGGDDCEFSWGYINGTTRPGANFSNYNAFWLNRARRFRFARNKVTGFKYATGPMNHNTAGFITYGGVDTLIENNDFWNMHIPGYIKGSSGGRLNSGIFRRNKVWEVDGGLDMQAILEQDRAFKVYQNVIYDVIEWLLNYGDAVGEGCVGTDIYNNTLVLNIDSVLFALRYGMFSSENDNLRTLNRFHDNIVAMIAGSGRRPIDVSSSTELWEELRNNGYDTGGAAGAWQWDSVSHASLAAFQDALNLGGGEIGQCDDNSVHAPAQFLDVDAKDFRLSPSSPFKAMGSTSSIGGAGSEIGAYVNNPFIGA